MPVHSTILKLPINGNHELHVVLLDQSRRVTFSIVEYASKSYRERATFELALHDAIKLARFIAGIQAAFGIDKVFEPESESEAERPRRDTLDGVAPPKGCSDDE